MDLRIGTSHLRGPLARYAQALDLLELRAEPGRLPRLAALRGYRRGAPPGFVFSVLLPRAVGELEPGPELEAGLSFALEVVSALDAAVIVLQTLPSATPSRRTERRIEELLSRLPREGRTLAWEPRGLWDSEQEEALASRWEVLLVRDLRRHPAPPGPAVYTRLLGLGTGARLSVDAAEIVAARLAGREVARVVVEGSGAERGAQVMRERLADEEFLAEARSGRIVAGAGVFGAAMGLAALSDDLHEDFAMDDADEVLDDDGMEQDFGEDDEDETDGDDVTERDSAELAAESDVEGGLDEDGKRG